jgi:hypothetical protein
VTLLLRGNHIALPHAGGKLLEGSPHEVLIGHFARLYRVNGVEVIEPAQYQDNECADLPIMKLAALVAHQLLLSTDSKFHSRSESVEQAALRDAGQLDLEALLHGVPETRAHLDDRSGQRLTFAQMESGVDHLATDDHGRPPVIDALERSGATAHKCLVQSSPGQWHPAQSIGIQSIQWDTIRFNRS